MKYGIDLWKHCMLVCYFLTIHHAKSTVLHVNSHNAKKHTLTVSALERIPAKWHSSLLLPVCPPSLPSSTGQFNDWWQWKSSSLRILFAFTLPTKPTHFSRPTMRKSPSRASRGLYLDWSFWRPVIIRYFQDPLWYLSKSTTPRELSYPALIALAHQSHSSNTTKKFLVFAASKSFIASSFPSVPWSFSVRSRVDVTCPEWDPRWALCPTPKSSCSRLHRQGRYPPPCCWGWWILPRWKSLSPTASSLVYTITHAPSSPHRLSDDWSSLASEGSHYSDLQ